MDIQAPGLLCYGVIVAYRARGLQDPCSWVRQILCLGLRGSAAALLGCAPSRLRESWLALFLWAPWARAWGQCQGRSNSREQWGWLLYGGFTDIVGLSVGVTGTMLTSLVSYRAACRLWRV